MSKMVDPTIPEPQLSDALAPEAVEPQVPVTPEPPQPPAQEPEAAIPSWRLREEADARRAAEERASALERRLGEVDAHFRQQQARQQPPQKPNWFENPDEAVQHAIVQLVGPILHENRRQMMAMSREVAEGRHGEDKVAEAEAAFLYARDQRLLDPADFDRVVNAPNRYDAVVRWYRRSATLHAVGDDPNAWFEAQLESRLKADPDFQAKVLEKIRGEAAARPASVTRVPPSLSRTTAVSSSGNESLGDMSDASLFAAATRKG